MQDVTDLLFGVARMFVGSSAYATTPDVLPSDDLPLYPPQPWGGTWRDVGFTQDGVKVTLNQTYNAIQADQSLTAVLHIRTGVEESIGTTLLQATLENIKLITGRGNITTNVSGGNHHRQLRLTADASITYVAIGFEGIAPPNDGSLPRRIIFPLCLATGNVEVGSHRNDVTKLAAVFMRVGGVEGEPIIRDVIPV